jgi:hypothetical protein
VSIQGGSYPRFKRALATGNLTLIRGAAAELPMVSLKDALEICALYRDRPAAYERAAIRWLGRWCCERPAVTLPDLRTATDLLAQLPGEPEETLAKLRALDHQCSHRP